MALLTSAPKGTQDILPSQSGNWHYIERKALSIAERYGFREMRTPTFEHTELFLRSVGDTTDVVQKEMYTFRDKKDRSITLRPEGTAGVVRAAIENGLLNGQLPLKISYIVNCFRYEKPQAGRLREFHQFGVELFGADGAAADAEVISLAEEALSSLGVTRIRLMLNSIGCKTCRPEYQKKLRAYFQEHEGELCETCKGRLLTNPMRIIDCKSPACKKLAESAPKMIGHLCPECEAHFAGLKKRLDAMGIAYQIDPDIVRGLDYYVRTVFEFVTDAIGAQGTVCGGGRYDGLVETVGGPALSGIGFAIGLERLLLVMAASGAEFPPAKGCDLYLAAVGDAASAEAGAIARKLRLEGFSVETDLTGRSLKAQMRYADKIGAAYSAVLGESELAGGTVKVRDMAGGRQAELPLGDGFLGAFYQLTLSKSVSDAADAAARHGQE